MSPLMSKYVRLAGVEESQESLVTLVLKADMGGFLSGAVRRREQLAHMLAPPGPAPPPPAAFVSCVLPSFAGLRALLCCRWASWLR